MTAARPRMKIISLTDGAAERVRDLMARTDRPVAGLRVGIKKGGCAGMEYTMEHAAEVRPSDEVVEDKGATVLVDPAAVLFLLGSEMDYVVDKMSSRFVFKNPNQVSACGCGESVSLAPASGEAAPAH